MTVQQVNSNISDDSDDMVSLPSEEDIYRRKYQLLLERCEVLQQDNERILNRIHEAKKITRRYRKDITLLAGRLDKHGDPFRTAAMEVDMLRPEVVPKAGRPSAKAQTVAKQADKLNASSLPKKPGPKRKSKADKPEKDPNAPKKPCNAFFQFCQEQRPVVVAEASSEMGSELTKQEVTRQLASRWRALTSEEKRVYVAMFERSKEKYAEEMSAYIKKEQ
ncbi:HMG (high mobility group) box domain-containing protein [Phthorimaea operculella]|nr:HMG (high mobility group) box domain-containing protein [Phthorimaea operculella]